MNKLRDRKIKGKMPSLNWLEDNNLDSLQGDPVAKLQAQQSGALYRQKTVKSKARSPARGLTCVDF